MRRLHVDPLVAGYAVQIASATREHPAVRYGASPRGSVALVAAARAAAAIEDRSFVSPDDVKTIAHAVLAHRIVLTPEAELNRRTAAEVLDDVLGAIPQPTPQPAAARA